MKIGIITLYDSMNYGAFLQAYALQQTLINIGNDDVEFINISNKRERIINFRKNVITKKINNLIFNIKRYENFRKSMKKLHVSKGNFYDKDEKYDVAFIGSDEVWNITNKTFNHHPIFFGNDLKNTTVATYAVSAGQAKVDDINTYMYCLAGIKNINYFSARDKNTVSIMKQLSNSNVEYVLDPTLLYDFNGKEEKVNISKNYLLIYSYSFNEEQIKYIKQYAVEKNLITVSAGFNNIWCDKIVPASPFGFLYLMSNASEVITNTFHGTLFAIIYKKNFAILSDRKIIKIIDVLEQFQLENRIVKNNSVGEIRNVLSREIDYKSVENIIKEKRDISIKYLKRVIKS